MRLSSVFTIAGTFAVAGVAALVSAWFSVELIEDASRVGIEAELETDALSWADVDTSGLQVFLIGTAPDEAGRFKALSAAGRVVDTARVIDEMQVEEAAEIAAPRFSVEILRNDAGVSLIGLLPAATDREQLLADFERIAGDADRVSDLLESADFPVPEGWDDALAFAIEALGALPRSKVSVEANLVAVKAMTDSAEDKRRIETELARRKPRDMRLALDLSAPRPVITPFNLRFVIDDGRARFDACSADTEESRDRILRAASRAGVDGKATCVLGLGVPSRRWGEAADTAIAKLAELGAGSVTFTNADVTLVAPEGTDQALFDRIIGELEAELPEVFALTAVLPKTPDASAEGPPEFTATLSPEGAVQLRGRLPSDVARQTADSYARARFGSTAVYTAARVDEDLPADWGVRALAGLEALSMLVNGVVAVAPDNVTIMGQTGRQTASADIAALMAKKLGEEARFDIDIEYIKKFDESLGLPSFEECIQEIISIKGDRKLSFEPGSLTLDSAAKGILDDIAEWLVKCPEIPLEIGGHTDSQGGEQMNQDLSQKRAQAVLDALRGRGLATASYTVKGYGETQPIADNGSEAGREANRRIEFKLLQSETDQQQEIAQEGASEAAAEGTGNEQN